MTVLQGIQSVMPQKLVPKQTTSRTSNKSAKQIINSDM